MGGDGGVIASNRKYLRGAGTADHTGDSQRHTEKTSDKQVSQELLRLCYLTKAPLFQTNQAIVADPYGRLYHKEAVVEALLRRKHPSEQDEFGPHVRGLKDLHPVRFHLNHQIPMCPVTGAELNGQQPAFLIPQHPHQHNNNSYDKDGVNVISERAIKEMGVEALQSDYGPFERSSLVRLAPPPSMMEEIIEAVRIQQEHELTRQSKKEKKRKLKHHGQVEQGRKNVKMDRQLTAARQRVQSAVQTNDILSSLFTDNTTSKSDKEKKDALFARMG
jgi:Rtf2 RING-finger